MAGIIPQYQSTTGALPLSRDDWEALCTSLKTAAEQLENISRGARFPNAHVEMQTSALMMLGPLAALERLRPVVATLAGL